MTEEMLSQEEIDALLNGGNIESPADDSGAMPPPDLPSGGDISEKVKEAFETLLNTSSTVIGTILNTDFSFSMNYMKRSDAQGIKSILGDNNYSFNRVEFTKGIKGAFYFLLKREDILVIAEMMMGGDGMQPPEELNEIYLSAIDEAFNQMMGSSANSLGNVLGEAVEINHGKTKISLLNESSVDLSGNPVISEIKVKLGDIIDSEAYLLFAENDYNSIHKSFEKEEIESGTSSDTSVLDEVAETNMNESALPEEDKTTVIPPQQQQPQASTVQQTQVPPPQQQQYQRPQAPPPQQQYPPQYQQGTPQAIGSINRIGNQPEIRPAQFTQINYQQTGELPSNIDMLMDVPLQITVELGRKKMKIKEILELGAGSVIELDKLAGESVDVLVNNKLIAKGEVVVIDENFGIRITTIVSASERLENMIDA